jgi:hypothetical protein
VVTTKIDLLAGRAEKPAIDAQLASFRQGLQASFASRLAKLSFWEIAARDPLGGFAPAYGVDALLADWVTPRPILVSRSKPAVRLETQFDRLLLRTPTELYP